MRSGVLCDSLPEHALITGGGRYVAWPTLLVVDSDRDMLEILVRYFEKRGFHVAAAASLAEAKAFFHRHKAWLLVVADYHLPDGTGIDLCGWVREQTGRPTPCLLMSGSADAAALCAGLDYLAKPFPLSALEERVRMLLKR